MSRLQLLGATRDSVGGSAPGGTWRDLYSDALPLASFWDHVIEVSPGDDLHETRLTADALGGDVLVLLSEGTYNANVYSGTNVSWVAEAPGTVVWEADGSTVGGRWSPINGTPFVLGGIHFRLLSGNSSGQYAYHATASGLQIAEECVFESLTTSRPTAVGADGSPGSRFYFLGCELVCPGATTSYLATNVHGTVVGAPAVTAFIGCLADGQVGYDDLDTGNADEFWFVRDAEGNGGYANFYNGNTPGINVTYYLDSDRVGPSGGGTFNANLVRTTSRPPVPVYGVL